MYIIIRILLGIIVPVILIGIGFLFIRLGKNVILTRKKLEKLCTESTTGVITKLTPEECNVEVDSHKKLYLWIASVQYEVNGLIYEKSLNGHKQDYFSIGEKVSLNYNPLNPEQFFVPQDRASQVINHYYQPIGFLFILIGIMELLIVNILFFIL